MTECLICHKRFDFLRPHLKVHKLSLGEYQEKFPDQKISKFFDVMFVENRELLITAHQRYRQKDEICRKTQTGGW